MDSTYAHFHSESSDRDRCPLLLEATDFSAERHPFACFVLNGKASWTEGKIVFLFFSKEKPS